MKKRIISWLERIRATELKIFGNTFLVSVLLLGNLIGAFIGFIYYFEVIDMAQNYPVILWILVPDCPMAAFLLLGVYIQKDRQQYLNYNYFAFIQGVRNAILAFLIISNFKSIDIEIVIIGHILLLIQAIAIIPFLTKLKMTKGTILAIAITIFNDISDFFGVPGIYDVTLAQMPTIKPMFLFFVIIIFSIDISLILLGIIISKLAKAKTFSLS